MNKKEQSIILNTYKQIYYTHVIVEIDKNERPPPGENKTKRRVGCRSSQKAWQHPRYKRVKVLGAVRTNVSPALIFLTSADTMESRSIST